MWEKTKTYKIVYCDNTVMYGDKRRTTFYEAYDRSGAIHKFQQDYSSSVIVRDCTEMQFKVDWNVGG